MAIITRELLNRLGRDMEDTTVAVQGYGNVGCSAATILSHMGCKVLAVSDISGGLYHPDGLDIADLNWHVANHPQHLLEGYQAVGAEKVSNDELITSQVDVLVPAALEHQIHAGNAPHIQAKVIVEGANGPTTPEADEILQDRGILVVPDNLANAGGVVVSYFEWVQDLQFYFRDEHEVNHNLERIMVRSLKQVWDCSQEQRVPLRLGAHILAVDRVTKAIHSRGVFP